MATLASRSPPSQVSPSWSPALTDTLTPAARSALMSRIRRADTKPELIVRRLLHAHGYRFRLQWKAAPGRPDVAFPGRRRILFVHGCFWHQHPDSGCRNAQVPRSNTAYWSPKLARTAERDREAAERLKAMGWHVLTIWECETKQAEALRRSLLQFLA